MVGPRIAGPVNGVRFSAPAPITPGRPLRSRRQSEKLEKHVRLVPLAPGGDRGRVAQACDCGSHYESSILSGHPIFHWEVAKPVRRLILNQIMRRFESSPPSHGRVADWQGTALSMQIKRVQFSPRSPDFCGVAKLVRRRALNPVIAGSKSSLRSHFVKPRGSNSTGEQRAVFQAATGRFDSGWPYQLIGCQSVARPRHYCRGSVS